MFYCINPNYRYQFFNRFIETGPEDDSQPSFGPIDNQPTDKPSKRNLVNALAALYRAYGGEGELKNNAVDIIYKIADLIATSNTEETNIEANPKEDSEDKY